MYIYIYVKNPSSLLQISRKMSEDVVLKIRFVFVLLKNLFFDHLYLWKHLTSECPYICVVSWKLCYIITDLKLHHQIIHNEVDVDGRIGQEPFIVNNGRL